MTLARTGILSGCVVSAQSTPTTTVQLSAGTHVVDDTVVDQPAVPSIDILGAHPADATNPRWDLILADSAGAVTVLNGTPTAPDFHGLVPEPTIDYTKQVLARVYVQAGATVISPTDVTPSTDTSPDVTAENGTAKLAADVTMTNANTFYDGPNTGPVGAAGQQLLLTAYATVVGGGASTVTMRITDGTNVLAEVSGIGATAVGANLFLSAIVSPSAAATYKIACASSSAGGAIKADPTANSSGAHVATRISYVRLA